MVEQRQTHAEYCATPLFSFQCEDAGQALQKLDCGNHRKRISAHSQAIGTPGQSPLCGPVQV